MFHSCSIVVITLLALNLIAFPAAAQSTEELEKKIDALTRRVEALERLNKTAQPKDTAAAKAQARQEVRALYGTVDVLLADGKLEEAHEAVAAFDAKYQGTSDAHWTRSLKREMEVVGKATPDDWFIEKWYQGESEIDFNGPPTLLIFWESWCPHCRSEVPKMKNSTRSSGPRGCRWSA